MAPFRPFHPRLAVRINPGMVKIRPFVVIDEPGRERMGPDETQQPGARPFDGDQVGRAQRLYRALQQVARHVEQVGRERHARHRRLPHARIPRGA
jgi:hypothetical protein